MIEKIPFQTRARTIDHLGREQIADCPTAISELWKNAYDAYARDVALHIFDGEIPVAAIVDDGHGMSKDDLINKWLVVGTDSKVTDYQLSKENRFGLPRRERQGQKGIGRLSSGAMGPFLLLISKRQEENFVAALIDWRLFENPYLMLHDVTLPVVEFEQQDELLTLLPNMFDTILDNIAPSQTDPARYKRVTLAWEMFNQLEAEQGKDVLTLDSIANTVIGTTFSSEHFSKWPTWKGNTDHGTALFVSDISFELIAQLESATNQNDLNKRVVNNFFKTLSGFYDPYALTKHAEKDMFNYEVLTWKKGQCREILAMDHQFDLTSLHNLEHYIDGYVDNRGVFKGNIRMFGEDFGIVEVPPAQLIATKNSREKVGPFHIAIGTFEMMASSSTHTPEEHALLWEQSELYAGMGVYRDNLRVLPYGREDNDFFNIDARRLKNAGRYFWSNKRMFGRIEISKKNNPNLRDKAGREGFIDNKARSYFREVVENLLISTALRYFGRESQSRIDKLPLIQEANRVKAEAAAKAHKRNNRALFRKTLNAKTPCLAEKIEELTDLADEIRDCSKTPDAERLTVLLYRLDDVKTDKGELRLPSRPKNLGVLEESYFAYKRMYDDFSIKLEEQHKIVTLELEKVNPSSPVKIAESSLRRHAKALHDQLRKWKNNSIQILEKEIKKITETVLSDNKEYDLLSLSLVDDLANGRMTLACVLDELDDLHSKLYLKYSEHYEPYLRAITQLSQGIDIEAATSWSSEKAEELEKELEQFTSLAQLGITVELVSHELERLDYTIGNHLRDLPQNIQQTRAFQSAFDAHSELMERLRFLSPLKLSGRSKHRDKITGEAIASYVLQFFGKLFEEAGIEFTATDKFKSIEIEEFRSRLFPVFINLINNSRYWVSQKDGLRKILLDIADGMIVVSDSGPGIAPANQEKLFKLFFTTRLRGRGVGLYLCKTNLARGKHKIEYAVEDRFKLLDGANFVIELKGLCNAE